ncbi:MAG: serine/threonine-protein kinase, partial [Planctomycetota bacterium]
MPAFQPLPLPPPPPPPAGDSRRSAVSARRPPALPPPPRQDTATRNAIGADAIGQRAGFAKFRIGDELGRGGVGTVQLAEDLELRRELAIKILHRPDDSVAVEHFIEEAQITGQLQHPNIVPVHEMGVDDRGRPWLAMKRIEGESLASWIERRAGRPLTADALTTIIDIFRRVCDAVAFAHDRGVMHRDLKPANVMVGHHGEVLVVDWGLARPISSSAASAGASSSSAELPLRPFSRAATAHGSARHSRITSSRRESADNLTVDGDIKGTPAYMPPEQASGDVDRMDERADIFALGGVLYCMLTCENPYSGDSPLQVLANAYSHKLLAPRDRQPSRRIPADLDAIVMKAMAASPRQRYRRVADLVADLQAFETHMPVSARRALLAGRMVKFTRRHPVGVLGTALALLFISIAGAVIGGLVAMAESAARVAAEQRRVAEDATRRAHEEATQRREAEVKALVAEGKLDALARLLDVQLNQQKEDALDRFNDEFAALRAE